MNAEQPVARTRTSEFYCRNDSIIVQAVVEEGRQTLADAQANARVYNELCEGVQRLLLVDMRVPYSTDPEVRKYYATPEASRFVVALAMVTHSKTTTLVGNFFLSLTSPPYPCKMFTELDKAASWLVEQVTPQHDQPRLRLSR